MSENKKNDFLASFNRDFWASKPFLRLHMCEIIGYNGLYRVCLLKVVL